MRFFLIGFIASLLVTFAGCSSKEKEKQILSEEEMIDLLVDMHITDATVMRGVNRGKIKKKHALNYYKGTLVKHGITRTEFDSVFDYYSHDFKRFSKMYEKVLQRIQQRKEMLELQKGAEKKKQKKEQREKVKKKQNK